MPDTTESTDAVLLAIVDRIACAEGKAHIHNGDVTYNASTDRAWLVGAFACARNCLAARGASASD